MELNICNFNIYEMICDISYVKSKPELLPVLCQMDLVLKVWTILYGPYTISRNKTQAVQSWALYFY